MYLNHFSLARLPFDFLLDPDLTYWSPGLKALWAEVTQRLGNGHSPQFVVARAGCGKSLFLHLLALHSIDQGHNCAYIDAASQRADLFESLSQAYGLEYPSQNEEQYLTWFESFLASSRLGGIQNVLLLDNAHRMDPQDLQKLVYLVKIRIDNTPLLHVVATVTEGEGDAALELLAANQISVAPRPLPPLDIEHTGAYIAHRLKAAGHESGDLFDDDVVEWIHARSRGIPREINYYADLFMTHAYLRHQRRIHARLIQLVDPTDTRSKPKEARPGPVARPEKDESKGKQSPSQHPEVSSDNDGKANGKAGGESHAPVQPTQTHASPEPRRKTAPAAKASQAPKAKSATSKPHTSGQVTTARGQEPPAAKRTETKATAAKPQTPRPDETKAAPATETATDKAPPPPPSAGQPATKPEDEAPAANRRGLFLAAAALVMLVLAGLVLLQTDDAEEVRPIQQATADGVEGEGTNTPIPVTRTPPTPDQDASTTQTKEPAPARMAAQDVTPKVAETAQAAPKPAVAPRSSTQAKEKTVSPQGASPGRDGKAKPKSEEPQKPAKTVFAKAEQPSPKNNQAALQKTAPPPTPKPRRLEAAAEEGTDDSTSTQSVPEASDDTETASPSPTPQAAGSEFASFTPAPNGQDTLMAVQALDNLVHRFQWAYENADEHVLAEIFDPNIRTNENSGRDAILKEYGQFFRVTQSRRLAIGPIEWQTSGAVSTGVGRFTAYVVTKRGKERTFTGTLTIETIATPKGPKITALYYRYDS